MKRLFKFTSHEAKEWALKQHLIAYYDTINQGKVAIPSFILADEDLKRVKEMGTLEFWYRRLQKAI